MQRFIGVFFRKQDPVYRPNPLIIHRDRLPFAQLECTLQGADTNSVELLVRVRWSLRPADVGAWVEC